MSTIKLPQDDDQAKRKAGIEEQSKPYKYNLDIGIPLVDQEGPEDKNKPDFFVKIFTKLMTLRTNQQMVYDKSGFQFQHPRPARDVPKLVEMVKGDRRPEDYFMQDPGFIINDPRAKRPKSINDYIDKVYMDRDQNNKGNAAVPEIATKWDNDRTFSFTMLAGCNPNQVKRYTAASKPADFDVTGVDLGSLPGFSGDNITTAIAAGRVYFIDHSDLKELFANTPGAPAPNATQRVLDKVVSDDWKYIYAPYAAFVVPPGGQHMLPIAIQCGPKAEGHQIYTPKDGYSWKMAKSCLLAAHNNHHEVVTHLGLTHLFVDAFLMATRIRLHKTHPVYQLLHPHFEGTASINYGARTSLIQPERSVDRLIGSKIELNYPYLKKIRLGHSFRQNFPKVRQEAFGVADTKLLPNYPYREDSILIWDATRAWVSDYVSIWYKSEAMIREDYELQAWALEIQDGGKVNEFCRTGGGVQSRDDLIDMLTMIIFTAGPQHAAANFPQHEMAYVPSNPLAGYAQAPQGTGHTEQDFLNILPPLDVAIHSYHMLNLLAGINNTRLGDYRRAFLTHPISEVARLKFVSKLNSIENQIKSSNKTRRAVYELEYVHLLPSRIPASINI